MRLRKIPLIVLFAAASAFGSKSAVANSCDFVIPIDEFAAFAHVSYTCVTNPFTGFSVCLRLWQTRTGDTYFATNDDDVPCLLTGFTLAQYPYVIDIRFNFGHPLGSPVLHTQTDTDHPMYPHWLPYNCFWGWCSLFGSASVLAYGPGEPDTHFRPFLLSVTY